MSTKLECLEERIQIPDGVKASLDGSRLKVAGKLGSNEYDFSHMGIELSLDGKEIVAKVSGNKRKARAMLGTATSIIKNMIAGVTKGFTYKMKIVASHFPMSVKVSGNEVIIENFLGERYKRRAKIFGNTKVVVKGDEVIVSGIDKYAVGQTATNIENATRIKKKDPRKFLDGIFVYKKLEGIES
ncbi:MAG: 50S ribosomal protein L6 [Nitrososphaerota archaeon]|nr:50S ribosomal protein L6 [Aigarchaeota archaeon]MDW8076269.1 50S ribosomal protein L6 [Nitrososphaerota archaeon]